MQNMNAEAFRDALARSEKPVLVDFWAPWCTYCRRIAPAFDKIAQQYADSLIVGKSTSMRNPPLPSRSRLR